MSQLDLSKLEKQSECKLLDFQLHNSEYERIENSMFRWKTGWQNIRE